MTAITLREIDERLRQLPPEKLAMVYDFISYLIERDTVALLPFLFRFPFLTE